MPRRVILGLVPSCNFFASPDQIERGSFPVSVDSHLPFRVDAWALCWVMLGNVLEILL